MSVPILITGCSSGIGHATAELLVGNGHLVYATARRAEAIADLQRAGARTLALQVGDEDSMRAAVEAVERDHGAVGVLVNNAGYAVSGAIEAVSLQAVRDEFETNLFGSLRLAQLVLPAMRARRRGRIINERAITAARPRSRYRVTPIARVLPVLRGVLGDRGFDRFLRTQIKPPG